MNEQLAARSACTHTKQRYNANVKYRVTVKTLVTYISYVGVSLPIPYMLHSTFNIQHPVHVMNGIESADTEVHDGRCARGSGSV